MLQEKEIQILMSLGLTSVQAKAYLTLIKLGNATVKTISKASSIVSQDTYRIMPQLQKRGLAEKIIAKPTRYQATPLNDGLHILLQKRAEEHAKLENETLWLLENFQEKDRGIDLQEEEPQLNVIAEKTLLQQNFRNQIQITKRSIDFCFPIEAYNYIFFDLYQDLTRAMRRGVKIRVLIEQSDKKVVIQVAQALKENPLFKIRPFFAAFPSGIAIFDNQEVTMAIADRGLPSLRTTNSAVVKLASSYFNGMWSKKNSGELKIAKIKSDRNFRGRLFPT